VDRCREDRLGTNDQRRTFNMSTDVYTADNALISINTTVDYEDVDPVRTVHESSYRRRALEEVAVWALRNDVGGRSLEQALNSQAEINLALSAVMEEQAARLGVKVIQVEVLARVGQMLAEI
jgi:regulator of protease activity HflC (stomatin/prohibitin superfamily)